MFIYIFFFNPNIFAHAFHTAHHYLSYQRRDETTAGPTALHRPRPGSYTSTSTVDGPPLAPPPLVPPRRHSETRELKPAANNNDEPDLISFSSGPSTDDAANRPPAPPNDQLANFQQLINDMHQMNRQLQQMGPIASQVATPPAYGFMNRMASPPLQYNGAAAAAAGLQIVPYQKIEQKPVSLTPDELNKLYAMNYTVGRPAPAGMIRPPAPQQYRSQIGFVAANNCRPPPPPLSGYGVAQQMSSMQNTLLVQQQLQQQQMLQQQQQIQQYQQSELPKLSTTNSSTSTEPNNPSSSSSVGKSSLTHSNSFSGARRRDKNKLGGDLIDLSFGIEDK